jgi:cardiolipin synthase A/B
MAGVLSRLKRSLELRFPRLTAAGSYVRRRKKRFLALALTVAHAVGALTSVQAVMNTRTAQGAVAWAVSLNTFPYLAVPAYWVFGRTKFEGSVTKRRGGEEQAHPLVTAFIARAKRDGLVVPVRDEGSSRIAERLAKLPATAANRVELLRDGGAIFPSIFEGIGQAKSYVLVQFYIVRDDALGRQLQQQLIAAARRGVRVHFVYDEVGSHGLPGAYIATLRDAGVEMIPFNTMKGIANRFQLNFRNHRKIVITDGRTAWTGSANIGDEYGGSGSSQAPSLDTMVKIEGPAVQTVQVSFWEDWLWASGRALELDWTPQAASAGASQQVLCLPSGPADSLETCTLYFLQLINSARQRLWIASPYFVPDEQLISALELAALRGVEVRILIPDQGDSTLVDLSGWAYVERLGKVGVHFYRHTKDFMHQKVTLVDSDLATVGSANFDNRSFRLNFEMTIEVRDRAFAGEVAAMLEKDFAQSRRIDPAEARARGFLFQLKVRSAILLSPIQ